MFRSNPFAGIGFDDNFGRGGFSGDAGSAYSLLNGGYQAEFGGLAQGGNESGPPGWEKNPQLYEVFNKNPFYINPSPLMKATEARMMPAFMEGWMMPASMEARMMLAFVASTQGEPDYLMGKHEPMGNPPHLGFGEIYIDTDSDGLDGYWAEKYGFTAEDLRLAKERGLTAQDLQFAEDVLVIAPKNDVGTPARGPSATVSPTSVSPIELPAPPSPQQLSPAAVDAISHDLGSLNRSDFYLQYRDRLDPKTLDQLLPVTRKPEFKLPAEDKTLYIDASGRQGTANSLARNDLLDRASDVAASSVLGGIYSFAATALGGDAREAARLGKIGDAVSSVATIAAFGAASLASRGSLGPAIKPTLPPATSAALPSTVPDPILQAARNLRPGEFFPPEFRVRWRPGDPPNYPDIRGKYPSWRVAQGRIKKNQALKGEPLQIDPIQPQRGTVPIDHIIAQRFNLPDPHNSNNLWITDSWLEHSFFDSFAKASDITGARWTGPWE